MYCPCSSPTHQTQRHQPRTEMSDNSLEPDYYEQYSRRSRIACAGRSTTHINHITMISRVRIIHCLVKRTKMNRPLIDKKAHATLPLPRGENNRRFGNRTRQSSKDMRHSQAFPSPSQFSCELRQWKIKIVRHMNMGLVINLI